MIKLAFLAAFGVVVWIIWSQYKAYKLNMEAEQALETEQLRLKRLSNKRKAQEVRKHNDAMSKHMASSKKSKIHYDDFDDDDLEEFIEDVVGAVAVSSFMNDVVDNDDVETVSPEPVFTPEPVRQSYEPERQSYAPADSSYDSGGSDFGGSDD